MIAILLLPLYGVLQIHLPDDVPLEAIGRGAELSTLGNSMQF